MHKSMLQSALTVRMDLAKPGIDKVNNTGAWSIVVSNQTTLNAATDGKQAGLYGGNTINEENTEAWITLAAPSLASTINLSQISVGVITSVLENVSFLRSTKQVLDRVKFCIWFTCSAENQYAGSTWSDDRCGYCRRKYQPG